MTAAVAARTTWKKPPFIANPRLRWAIGIGTLLAIPTAYCAARNTTPSRAFVRPVALFVIVASRSINSLI